MYKIKEFIRKSPIIFKVFSRTYQNFISPITSGFILNYLCYLSKDRRSDIARLRLHGFEDIKQFRPKTWRYGKGRDNAFRRYYISKLNGGRYFIKIAENDETVKNEIKIHKHFNLGDFIQTPKCKIADNNFTETQVMLAFTYIEGLHQIKIPTCEKELEIICNDFLSMCDFLFDKQIIHADIHKGNLLQKADGSLILLDFGISMVHTVENTVNYIARPGTFFVENENIREYNDVYSFLKMMDSLGLSEELKHTAPYNKILDLINRYSQKVDLNNCF